MIDFEREFFSVARNLETKSETREAFLTRIQQLSEDWIDDKLRQEISGLKEE